MTQTKATVTAPLLAYVGSREYEAAEITYKSELAPDFDESRLPDELHADLYAIDTTKTTYKVNKAANDGTGPTIETYLADLSSVSTYGAGTEIVASYTFTPKNLSTTVSEQISAKKLLRITKAEAIKPTVNPYGPLKVAYGTGINAPEPKDLDSQTDGNAGYKPSPVVETAIVQSQLSTINNENSPPKGTKITDWSATKNWNFGTVVQIPYRYDVDEFNYTGVSITFLQYVEISRKDTAVPTDITNNASTPAAWSTGSSVEDLKVPPAYETDKFNAPKVEWSRNDPPSANDPANPDFDAISSLSSGDTFVVSFQFTLNDNHYNANGLSFYFVKNFYRVS